MSTNLGKKTSLEFQNIGSNQGAQQIQNWVWNSYEDEFRWEN